MDIKSKVAIVTGASSGIGYHFSKMLVNAGAKVYGLARSVDKLKQIEDELGNHFIPVQMDVRDHDKMKEWTEDTFKKDHLPDILINNAGMGYFADIENLKIQEWDNMIDINLSGVFYLTRCIVPLMKENDSVCHIINIASIAGILGNPSMTGYNASKFGLRGFSEALFKEVRYDGIKVTCLFPGSIATSFFDRIDEMDTHPGMMQPEDMADTIKFLLQTPDNFLINEMTMRPLNPKAGN